MTPYLLDVNVLIALAWPNHVHHGEALRWFEAKAVKAFRTCPMTQAGFVRISPTRRSWPTRRFARRHSFAHADHQASRP